MDVSLLCVASLHRASAATCLGCGLIGSLLLQALILGVAGVYYIYYRPVHVVACESTPPLTLLRSVLLVGFIINSVSTGVVFRRIHYLPGTYSTRRKAKEECFHFNGELWVLCSSNCCCRGHERPSCGIYIYHCRGSRSTWFTCVLVWLWWVWLYTPGISCASQVETNTYMTRTWLELPGSKFDASRRGKKELNSSRDKNAGHEP